MYPIIIIFGAHLNGFKYCYLELIIFETDLFDLNMFRLSGLQRIYWKWYS